MKLKLLCKFSAAGDPEITIYNDAVVYYNGTVVWKPPAIYKSFCEVESSLTIKCY